MPNILLLKMVLFPFMLAYDAWAGCAGANFILSPRTSEASWYTACVPE